MRKSSFTTWIAARWGYFISAGVLGLTGILAYSHGNGPPCLLRTMFHIPCPGCGMTRSLEALWRGDLITSIRYHPLGLPLFLACALILLVPLLRKASPRLSARLDALTARLNRMPLAYGVAGILLTVWLIRLGLKMAGNTFFQWDDIPHP